MTVVNISASGRRLSSTVLALDSELSAIYQGLNDDSLETYAEKHTYDNGDVEFEVYTQVLEQGAQDGITLTLDSDGVTVLVTDTLSQNNNSRTLIYT